MKTQIILFFTGILFVTSCSLIRNEQSFRQNQNDALNDFLETKITNETDSLVIIKGKIKNEETIKIFHGDYIIYPDTSYVRREGGVEPPFYNEKNWLKMKKKYNTKIEDSTKNGEYWNEGDFKHTRIEFISNEELRKNINSGKYIVGLDIEKKAYFFSSPIYYKKKYLTFTVNETTTKFFGLNTKNYIIIMKKINDKWIVQQQVYSNKMY